MKVFVTGGMAFVDENLADEVGEWIRDEVKEFEVETDAKFGYDVRAWKTFKLNKKTGRVVDLESYVSRPERSLKGFGERFGVVVTKETGMNFEITVDLTEFLRKDAMFEGDGEFEEVVKGVLDGMESIVLRRWKGEVTEELLEEVGRFVKVMLGELEG